MKSPIRLLAFVALMLLLSACAVACSQETSVPRSESDLPTGDYVVNDTGQLLCFNAANVISCPDPGEPFYGHDSQYAGNAPSFTLSQDGGSVPAGVYFARLSSATGMANTKLVMMH